MSASNHSRTSVSFLAAGVVTAGVLALAGGEARAVVVGPGAFEYRYNSQNATGTGAADPNAVLDNVIFRGSGTPTNPTAPNTPSDFVNFYSLESSVPANPGETGRLGTLTYTFDASAGQEFDGNAGVRDRINNFSPTGNIRGEFSTNGGTTFSEFNFVVFGDPERDTNSIDVDGADSVILRYTFFSLVAPGSEDQTQLFRQANPFLAGLEETPFVFSGTTVAAAAVPEPASLAAIGAGGLMLLRRRRAR